MTSVTRRNRREHPSRTAVSVDFVNAWLHFLGESLNLTSHRNQMYIERLNDKENDHD